MLVFVIPLDNFDSGFFFQFLFFLIIIFSFTTQRSVFLIDNNESLYYSFVNAAVQIQSSQECPVDVRFIPVEFLFQIMLSFFNAVSIIILTPLIRIVSRFLHTEKVTTCSSLMLDSFLFFFFLHLECCSAQNMLSTI